VIPWPLMPLASMDMTMAFDALGVISIACRKAILHRCILDRLFCFRLLPLSIVCPGVANKSIPVDWVWCVRAAWRWDAEQRKLHKCCTMLCTNAEQRRMLDHTRGGPEWKHAAVSRAPLVCFPRPRPAQVSVNGRLSSARLSSRASVCAGVRCSRNLDHAHGRAMALVRTDLCSCLWGAVPHFHSFHLVGACWCHIAQHRRLEDGDPSRFCKVCGHFAPLPPPNPCPQRTHEDAGLRRLVHV
jgi:hypothetical protein